MLVVSYIHPNVLHRGFRLNGKFVAIPRNMTEQGSGDTAGCSGCHQISINTLVGDMQGVIHGPQIDKRFSKNSSITTVSQEKRNEIGSSSQTYPGKSCSNQTYPDLSQNQVDKKELKKKKQSKQKTKSYEVTINEPEEIHNDTSSMQHCEEKEETDVPSHVKTKRAFEERRKERGESWLIPDNSYRKYVTSSPKVPDNTPVFHSSNGEAAAINNICSELQCRLESHNTSLPDVSNELSSPLAKEMTEVLDIEKPPSLDNDDRQRHISKQSDDIEVLEPNMYDINENISQTLHADHPYHNVNENDISIYQNNGNSIDNLEENFSDEESEDSIFFVESQHTLKSETLSVNIGAKYAKEKDMRSGKLLDKLDLCSLSSVDILNKEEGDIKRYEVHLKFDTVKSSRQKRCYVFDDSETAKAMLKILKPFADARTLEEASIGALECLKCGSQFSKQVAQRKILKTKARLAGQEFLSSSYDSSKDYLQETDACPNCGSTIVVEMERIPLPTVAAASNAPKQNSLAIKSSGNTSNDTSANSSPGTLFANLFSSIKISPVLKRKNASFETKFPEVSKPENLNNSFQAENDAPKQSSDSHMSRNSSDVTIISNPSQSSIAVIPDPENVINNLNTIVERDSQSSMSRPVSRSSAFLSSDTAEENQSPQKVEIGINEVGIPRASNSEDQDFCSFTESNDGNNRNKGGPDASSGSELYYSPNKSAKSSDLKSQALSEADIDESDYLIRLLGEKGVITYERFHELDHRLKLHLEINVFGKDEEFYGCIQTSIVPLSTGEEFSGLFVLSIKKMYIIKFVSSYPLSLEQGIPVEKTIQVMYSGPINHLKQIKVILGNQGLTFACGPSSHVYTLIIRDADVCNSFSSFISELVQDKISEFSKIEFLSSTDETLQMLNDSVLSSSYPDGGHEILLHLFAFWNGHNGEKDPVYPICIILTHDYIFMSKILYKKQDSCTDLSKTFIYQYFNADHQKITDLVSLKVKKDLRSIEVDFLNESSTVSESSVSWTVRMQTKSALFSFINSLKNPWESAFCIPIPLSLDEN